MQDQEKTKDQLIKELIKLRRRVNELGNNERCIAELKRAEKEKLTLERQVQQAQKMESLVILAGGIAHDFNNLLMAILGNTDLALGSISPLSPARNNLKEIKRAAKRAAELAKQMLAYSGKGRFVVQSIDLAEFIEEISHLLEISTSEHVSIKYNLTKGLPTFNGDVTQIGQILINLVTNASESIGEKSGLIILSIGAMECDRAYLNSVDEALRIGRDKPLAEGTYVYIEVSDTGCGLNADTIEKIFDPFFTTKFTGRGLGMSAVLGIVRGHNGAIKIYSEVNKGTTLKILFPANNLPQITSHKHSEIPSSKTLPSGTILVADDEEIVCTVSEQMLNRLGFKVITAPNGRDALTLFQKNKDKIICVLLDLTMPHMDGEETFREMRRIKPEIAVVLCSGYNEQEATQRFAGKGLAGFIHKPFNLATLREKLAEVLQ